MGAKAISTERVAEIWDAVLDAARISELSPATLAASLIDARRALDVALGGATTAPALAGFEADVMGVYRPALTPAEEAIAGSASGGTPPSSLQGSLQSGHS